MCQPKIPKASTPAAAPPPPNMTASRLKMSERPKARNASGPDRARSRRTMRTDVKMPGGAGANIARMG